MRSRFVEERMKAAEQSEAQVFKRCADTRRSPVRIHHAYMAGFGLTCEEYYAFLRGE